jgi:hypothetical protein
MRRPRLRARSRTSESTSTAQGLLAGNEAGQGQDVHHLGQTCLPPTPEFGVEQSFSVGPVSGDERANDEVHCFRMPGRQFPRVRWRAK